MCEYKFVCICVLGREGGDEKSVLRRACVCVCDKAGRWEGWLLSGGVSGIGMFWSGSGGRS